VLRLGIALEDTTVLELEHVEALGFVAVIQFPDLGHELIGAAELVEDDRVEYRMSLLPAGD